MKKLISFVLKSIIFCVVWFIQMTIIIYFNMEVYGELKPNPFIALGGLVSLYLSYRVFKKIDLSEVFDFLSKREDKTISHQEEPMKKEFSEPTAVKKGNKILFMPKKIFYTVSTLCLLSLLVFVVWWVRFSGVFNFECSPNSIFFNVKYDYVKNSTNTVLVDGIRYNKSDMTLFSGEYTEATSGDVYLTCYAYSYQNGLKHGYSFVWQKHGYSRGGFYIFRGKYKKGLKHGLIEEWWSNGQLKSRGNYKNGKVDGLMQEWYDNGQLKSRGNYKDGLIEEWYDNGQLKSRGNYKDGLRDGLIEEWYYDGQLKSRGNYKNGQWDGVIEKWYSSGQLKLRGNYKDGLIEEWYYNGQLKSRGNYKNGQVDGVIQKWYSNGQMKSEGNLKYGMEQFLKDFLETARVNNYSWDIIMPNFPELKNVELQILKDYAETARVNNYNWDIINPKFPELFDEDLMKTVDLIGGINIDALNELYE